MPNDKIQEQGVKFSKEYQPVNRRTSTKFLTALLTKNLNKKKDIEIEGIDTTTGEKTRIKVTMPTKEAIIHALLKQAENGNINAIREVLDRVEGKAMQPMELTGEGGGPLEVKTILGMEIL